MGPWKWELRRQVLWVQGLTALILIVVVVGVEFAHAMDFAVRLASATGSPLSSWVSDPGLLKDQLGLVCLVLGVSIAGNALVSWRVRSHTRGLGTQAIARMLDYYESVLHAAHEGMVLLDEDGRVQLLNDEACRLLGLRPSAVDTLVEELPLSVPLRELMISGRRAENELHVGGQGVIVVNQTRTPPQGRTQGRVLTLRDHTELQALTGELDAVRSLANSLSAQNHEAVNRLHAVLSLIEIGAPERARELVVAELEVAQALTDQVLGAVGDPVVAAMLLAKLAQARERGVELDIGVEHGPLHTVLPAQDVVTIMGNLLDNAIEAARRGPSPRRVAFAACREPTGLELVVTNTRADLDDEALASMFDRGWTTKAEPGHGLGLALVRQTVARWEGSIVVDPDAELDAVNALAIRVRLAEKVLADG